MPATAREGGRPTGRALLAGAALVALGIGAVIGARDLLRRRDAPAEEQPPTQDARRLACDAREVAGCAALAAAEERDGRFDDAAVARRRACEAGDNASCGMLALLAIDARITLPEGEIAADLAKGCDGRVGRACAVAARRTTDPGQAKVLFGRACLLNEASSCNFLSDQLGEAASPHQVGELAKLACGGQGADALVGCHRFARINIERRRASTSTGTDDSRTRIAPIPSGEIAALFEKACDGNIPEACAELAALVREDEIVARDVQRANALDDRACKDGYYAACTTLARELTDTDPRRALELYDAACQARREAEACSAAARLEERPERADPTAAAMHWIRGCEIEASDACSRATDALELGRGVPVDRDRALLMWKRLHPEATTLPDRKAGRGRITGGYRSKPPQVRMGGVSVSDRMAPDYIYEAVAASTFDVLACARPFVDPTGSLNVSLSFVVDPSGHLSHIVATSASPPASACARRVLGEAVLRAPDGGVVRVEGFVMRLGPPPDAPAP